MSHTTTTREANVIEITTDHYVIRMHRKTARSWQKDFDKKVRLYVSGTQVTTMAQPAYSIKGEDPDLDAAWRKYNRLELLAMKAAYSEAFAEAGLEFDGRWGFSRKAGCSCGCSAGFVHTEPRIMAAFGDRDATPERVDSIHVSVRKQEQDPNLVAGDAILEPETPAYTCSYCDRPALYVGDGQDGDFYCGSHRSRAFGSVSMLDEPVAEPATEKDVEPDLEDASDEPAVATRPTLACPKTSPHIAHGWFTPEGMEVCPGVKRATDPNAQEISVTLTRGAWNTLRGILGRAERAYESDAESFEAIAQMMEAQGVEPKNSPDNASYSRDMAEFARQFGQTFTVAVL